MDTLLFLAPAVVMTILLVAIHAYLGLHVLEREVIFVDISLSQVAVLGSALSLFFFDEKDPWPQTAFSLGLCVLVALLLSFLKKHEKKIPQEALIGITYAMASGLLILVLDKLPHGAEHLREALVGNILFVSWPDVLKTFVIYAAVAVVHVVFRRQFWAASRGENQSFFWDFLFYVLFGVVITFSTQHAGVLVVFTILVIPAALAMRFFSQKKIQLLVAWILGVAGTLLSFLLSYEKDYPAGATIVVILGLIFFAGLCLKVPSRQRC